MRLPGLSLSKDVGFFICSLLNPEPLTPEPSNVLRSQNLPAAAGPLSVLRAIRGSNAALPTLRFLCGLL